MLNSSFTSNKDIDTPLSPPNPPKHASPKPTQRSKHPTSLHPIKWLLTGFGLYTALRFSLADKPEVSHCVWFTTVPHCGLRWLIRILESSKDRPFKRVPKRLLVLGWKPQGKLGTDAPAVFTPRLCSEDSIVLGLFGAGADAVLSWPQHPLHPAWLPSQEDELVKVEQTHYWRGGR